MDLIANSYWKLKGYLEYSCFERAQISHTSVTLLFVTEGAVSYKTFWKNVCLCVVSTVKTFLQNKQRNNWSVLSLSRLWQEKKLSHFKMALWTHKRVLIMWSSVYFAELNYKNLMFQLLFHISVVTASSQYFRRNKIVRDVWVPLFIWMLWKIV